MPHIVLRCILFFCLFLLFLFHKKRWKIRIRFMFLAAAPDTNDVKTQSGQKKLVLGQK